MRMALEQAMQRQDKFLPAELVRLMEHPGLAPLLRNLIFVDDAGSFTFCDEPARLSSSVKLAHPYDLLQSGKWPEWQKQTFLEERVQPFKQVFRELYVLTATERDARESTRYGGHQLHPRQALAILGKRGWVVQPEGGVTKTLHAQ